MGDQSWAKTDDFSGALDDMFGDLLGDMAGMKADAEAAGVDINAKMGAMGEDTAAAEAEEKKKKEEEAAADAEQAEKDRKAAERALKRKNMSKEEKMAKMKVKPLQKKAEGMKGEGKLADEKRYEEALVFIEEEEWIKAESALKDATYDAEEEERKKKEEEEANPDEIFLPFVSYQCVAKKGVVLRPTAGCGKIHSAEQDGLVQSPGEAGTSRRLMRGMGQLAARAAEEVAGEAVPGGAKLLDVGKAAAEKIKAENEKLRNWVGTSPTMYGVAVVLLPPVFTALVDRLKELNALRNATLFLQVFAPPKLSSVDEREMHELQRHLFAKDAAPTGKKKDRWPAWGMAPSKAATEEYDEKRHKRVKAWSDEKRYLVYGRSSGDPSARQIREKGGLHKCENERIIAELLVRWMWEREDVQVPPDLRDRCKAIKTDVDVSKLYKWLDGKKRRISSSNSTNSTDRFNDEIMSSGPLRALAGLLQVRNASIFCCSSQICLL